LLESLQPPHQYLHRRVCESCHPTQKLRSGQTSISSLANTRRKRVGYRNEKPVPARASAGFALFSTRLADGSRC
jgi:hypothetical protein